jgi:hypothetical protein
MLMWVNMRPAGICQANAKMVKYDVDAGIP